MNKSEKGILSGGALKLIAMVAMFIDHVGASLLEVYVLDFKGRSPLAGMTANPAFWYQADFFLRRIGRIAFPIFGFLLIEGARHTRNLNKYMLRLFLFALISEIPFDLAFSVSLVEPGYQNVFFTLFLGLCAVRGFMKWGDESWQGFVGLGLTCVLAELLNTDYGAYGVLAIAFLYLLREQPFLRCLVCTIVFFMLSPVEWPVVFSFLLIALYNGKRGYQPKYFFYLFYPVHLLLLWAVAYFVLPGLL